MSINKYALYQGSVVGLFSVLSLGIPSLISRFDPGTIIRKRTWLSLGALMVGFLISVLVPDNPLIITACMWVYVIGITLPPTFLFVAANEPLGETVALMH